MLHERQRCVHISSPRHTSELASRTCHEQGSEKNDEDGCRREEKENKTETEVDGECKCGLEGEVTVGRGDAKSGCVEATGKKHPLHLEVGNDPVEKVVSWISFVNTEQIPPTEDVDQLVPSLCVCLWPVCSGTRS